MADEARSSRASVIRVGHISGSAKHRHKVHILVEIGPPSEGEYDRDEGNEYEAKYGVTACGLDTRTKSKHRWRALVLRPLKEDELYEPYVCAHCRRKLGRK